MKPIHLNLASRPFRDYRPVYAVVVVSSLLIAFLMLNNVDTFIHYRQSTGSTRAAIADFEAQADLELRRAQAVDGQLRGLNLAALDKKTRFINTQLAQRAFSWSELLDHLENALAEDVRVVSIAPSFGDTGIVHLELNAEAKSADGMVNTITRLNREGSFANPFPKVEDAGEHGGFRFTLGVDYKPSAMKVVKQ